MKGIFLLVLVVSGTVGHGQSMFFDSLDHSTWIASAGASGSTWHNASQIPLSKLVYPRDSIKEDVIILTFKDGVLTTFAYDHRQKKDSLMAIYSYETIRDKGILQIRMPGEEVLYFRAGMISTGNHAILLRVKLKSRCWPD